MPEATRTNSTSPSPKNAPGQDDVAPEAESAEVAADERSLEERIEEALSSLSEVLEQADPFGDLAAAAARATGKDQDQNTEDGASFEAPTDAEAPASVEVPADEPVAGEPESEPEAEPEAVVESAEVAEVPATADGAEAAAEPALPADAMTPPDPEESIESIESLLGEVEAALGDPEPAAGGSDEPADGAGTPGEPTAEDESALLASALDEVDESDSAGGDDLPEPSLEAELAHEASLAAAYEEGEPLPAEAAVDIADEIAAIDELEGGSESVGAAEAAAAPEPEAEPSPAMDAEAEPVEAARSEPEPAASPEPEPERAAPAAAAEPASVPEAKGEPAKPKKEPLLARVRLAVASRVYRVCTKMSGPLTRLPVSMRDPVGAIAAFTLINALLVWVLVLVLR